MTRHPCHGRSQAQVRAFERIATGQVPVCAQRTLDALVADGLIEKLPPRFVHSDLIGPIRVLVYDVPIRHHIAWCEWCSANHGDK